MKSELSSATHSRFVVFGKFTELLQAPGSSQMKDPAKCLMYNRHSVGVITRVVVTVRYVYLLQ